MSAFEAMLSGGLMPALFALHGRAASYAAGGAAAVDITVVLAEAEPAAKEDGGAVTKRRAKIQVQAAEVATPAIGAVISVGTDAWTVVDKRELPGGAWELTGEWVVRSERSRADYRGGPRS